MISSPDPKTSIIEIRPSNPKAARLEVRFEADFGAYLTVGVGSVFEIPLKGKRYTEFGFPQEVELLCRAVIEGNFKEYLLMSKGKLLGATGEVVLEDQRSSPVKESWVRLGLGLLSRKERKVHSYEPY